LPVDVDLIPACDEVVSLSSTTVTTQLVFIFSMSKPHRIPEVTSATSEPPAAITVTKQENRRYGGSGGKFTYVKVYEGYDKSSLVYW
jgi:hypothetical protein